MAIPDSVQRRRETFDILGILTTDQQVITATGAGTGVRVGRGAEFEIRALIDTISGTSPTLDLRIEGSDTGAFGGEEVTVLTFEQLTDATDPLEVIKAFKAEHEYIRADWTAGGTTPSFRTTVSLRS